MSTDEDTFEQEIALDSENTNRSLMIMAVITVVLGIAVYLLGFALRSEDSTPRASNTASADTAEPQGSDPGAASPETEDSASTDEDGMQDPWAGNVPGGSTGEDAVDEVPSGSGSGGGSADGSDTAADSDYGPGSVDHGSGQEASAAMHRDLVTALNRHRASHGCALMVEDIRLSRAAMGHSMRMARVGQLGTMDVGDGTPAFRAQVQGYPATKMREVVAASLQTPTIVVDQWRSDSVAWNKITNCSVGHVGVGIFESGGQRWWTATFALDAR